MVVYDVFVNGTAMSGHLPQDHGPSDWLPRDSSSYQTRLCSHGDWQAISIGPFTTSGGMFWTEFNGVFQESFQGDGKWWTMSSFALGNINSDNELIGFPPIHIHHFHTA